MVSYSISYNAEVQFVEEFAVLNVTRHLTAWNSHKLRKRMAPTMEAEINLTLSWIIEEVSRNCQKYYET